MFSLKQVLLQILPLIFIFALTGYHVLVRHLQKVRVPIKDRLLRPPGESLRLKLEQLDETCMSLFMGMMLAPLVAFFSLAKLHWAFPLMFTAITSGIMSLFLSRKLSERRNYWLGFQGERAVAEELNQLMRKGCMVFHDLQMPDKANIDHVVVGPTGVFVVETKTRRKRRARAGKEDHKIIFDGKVLHFPHRSDTYGLMQAERNAGWLGEQLSKALAEPIRVTPVLTFPGWFIERTGRGKVHVVHHKEITKVIASNIGDPLNPKQLQQITAWLEDRCRNVEF